MRLGKSLLVLVVVAFGADGQHTTPSPALSSGPPLEPSLLKAMKDYDSAQLQGNRAEMERLVAPDYLIVRPGGLGDRASLIRNVAGPGVKTDPFTIVQPFTRNYGSTVIAGGWCNLHGTENGKPWVQRTRFADVWTKRNGHWMVVMTTLTPSETP